MWAIGPLCTPVIQWHAHTHQPSYLGSRLTSPHPLMPHFITLLSDGLSPFIFFPHIWLLFYLLFSLFFHFILLSLPVSLMLYFLTLFMFSDCSLVLLLCILYAAIHPSLWMKDGYSLFEYFSDVIHVLYSILYSVFFCGSIYLLLERLGIRRAILFDTCVLVTFGSSRGGCLTFTLKNFMDVECFRKISLLSIILKNTNPFNGKQAFDFQWVKYSGHTMSIWIPILTLS